MAALRALLAKELRQHGGAVGPWARRCWSWPGGGASFVRAGGAHPERAAGRLRLRPLSAGGGRAVAGAPAGGDRILRAHAAVRGGAADPPRSAGPRQGGASGWRCSRGGRCSPWRPASGRRRAREPVDARFVAIMAARLGVFVFALWGVVFLLGFFGRLRVALAGARRPRPGDPGSLHHLRPGAASAPSPSSPARPSASSASTSPGGRWPEAAAIGALGLAAGWALARVREGSVVEALARPLAARELAALLVVGVGGGAAFFASFERERGPGALRADDRQGRAPDRRPAGDRLLRGRPAPGGRAAGRGPGADPGGVPARRSAGPSRCRRCGWSTRRTPIRPTRTASSCTPSRAWCWG